MTVDSKASGRWVATEEGLGQTRSLPHYQPKDAFFTEIVKVGRYDLIYRIGSGGMATVFVARLSGLAGFERLVAVKVIHQHLADSRKFVQMFLDEARMAASIHHPNVVETYEVGRDEGLFYIVGEFVPGQDLNRLLRRIEEREIALPQGMVAKIASEICFGLHAAHETRDKEGNLLNLIHRDVSPNNILVSYDGYVRLIDFGVAWARNKMAHTESGALKGKIGYISPEQITGQSIDRRSDIFSVGVLAYTMATLTHPFPGDSDAERLNKIITGDMLPPSEMQPDIHPEFERIILKAMSSSPLDRYDTAADMGKALEAFAESTGDGIKAESLSALMEEMFADEKATHEARIFAYRTAIEHGGGVSDAFAEEDLFLSDTETYAETSRPSYREVSWYGKLGKRRRLVLFSALGGVIVAMAALFVLIFHGGAPSTNGAVGNGEGGGDHAAMKAPPEDPVREIGTLDAAAPTVVGEGLSAGEPRAVMENVDDTPENTAGAEAPGVDETGAAKSGRGAPSRKGRRQKSSKDSEPGLITNPYKGK